MDLMTDLLFQLARTKIIWLPTGMLSFLVCPLLHFVCRPNIVGSGGMSTTFMCSCLATSSLCLFATEMMFVGGRIMQLWPNFVLVLIYFILFCFILTYFISILQFFFPNVLLIFSVPGITLIIKIQNQITNTFFSARERLFFNAKLKYSKF